MAKNISYDDGYMSFTLNGDKDRVIRFNPSDLNIIKRATEAAAVLDEAEKSLTATVKLNPDGTIAESGNSGEDMKAAIDLLNGFETVMREQLNYIFNSDVYDIVFAGQSPLSTVGKNKIPLYESFLDGAMAVMSDEITENNKASKARTGKYTKGYK